MRRAARQQVRFVVAALAVSALVAAGCSGDDESGSGSGSSSDDSVAEATTSPDDQYAVGLIQLPLVDTSRETPENEGVPAQPERTLVTDVLYPAEGDPSSSAAVEEAPGDPSGGPYPLVVFSHGLGASFELYQPLLERWAAAGYVVAAPRHPLTYAGTEGGLNAADVQEQPGDQSFVIDALTSAAEEGDPVLGELIDPERVGVAGHSNGAITTLGSAANTCCREDRADAAIVLSGASSPFADGEYDFADMPPAMWVHGTEDQQVSYDGAVAMFNEAEGPKGLLTVEGGDHGSFFVEGEAFDGVAAATIDLWDAYLGHDEGADDRLADFSAPGLTLEWVGEPGSTVTVPTTAPPETDREATASPAEDLAGGDLVTVEWSGFLPDGTVNVVQCSGDGESGGSAACDLNGGFILQPNPTGEGSTQIEVVEGPVGTGVCDADNDCFIIVNDSGLTDEEAIIRIPITFAG